MKKKIILIILAVCLLGASLAKADVSAPNFFKKLGNNINFIQPLMELGSSSARVAKGWFTSLDATSANIGTLQITSSVDPGPLSVAQATNPTIRFKTDTDSGISWNSDNNIGLMTGGTNRLTVASGNVGIGSTAPGARLQVVGADSLNTSFAGNISGATGTGLVITNAGNVGIGTTGPTAKLQVVNAGSLYSTVQNTASSTFIELNPGAGTNYLAYGGGVLDVGATTGI